MGIMEYDAQVIKNQGSVHFYTLNVLLQKEACVSAFFNLSTRTAFYDISTRQFVKVQKEIMYIIQETCETHT